MIINALLLLVAALAPVQAQASEPVFQAVQEHVLRQIHSDVAAFILAEDATIRLYGELHSQGKMESTPALDQAREKFNSAQNILSVSLTYYHFLLLSEGSGDLAYQPAELRDALAALGIEHKPGAGSAKWIKALTDKFEAMHAAVNVDALLKAQEFLYERNYRLTPEDVELIKKAQEIAPFKVVNRADALRPRPAGGGPAAS